MSDGCCGGSCACGQGIQIGEYSASAKNSENFSAAEVEEPIFESHNINNPELNVWRTPQIYPLTDGAIND
ncbi:MAG: hypothetical protein RLZZ148_218 [Cyanobacteriota bacterium]|jgi:hypothetical protein